MKKLLAILMALTIVLSFAACAGKTEPAATPTDETTAAEPVATPENALIRLATTTSVNDSGLLG